MIQLPTSSGFPAAKSRGEGRVRDQTNKQKDLQKRNTMHRKKDLEKKEKKMIHTNKQKDLQRKENPTQKNVCKERNNHTNKQKDMQRKIQKMCKGESRPSLHHSTSSSALVARQPTSQVSS